MKRRPYSRHGLNTLKKQMLARGLDALDHRSAPGRALMGWRGELLAALGRRRRGDHAAASGPGRPRGRTRLYVDHLDAFLIAQRSLITRRLARYPTDPVAFIDVCLPQNELGQPLAASQRTSAPSWSRLHVRRCGAPKSRGKPPEDHLTCNPVCDANHPGSKANLAAYPGLTCCCRWRTYRLDARHPSWRASSSVV
jgi:hypothetical protein